MKVVTPEQVTSVSASKYTGVVVAAKYARKLNELPREHTMERERKLTTIALDELVANRVVYEIRPKK